MASLLYKSPKCYNNVFLLVGLTTLGALLEFWLVYLVEWPNVSTTKGTTLCFIIGDVHHYIGRCLIPLDPLTKCNFTENTTI